MTALLHRWPGRYTDRHGTEEIVFESDGRELIRTTIRGVGFEGETTINRKDWGLTWNAALETGGVLVSEKIKLEFDVSAIRNA